MMGGDSSALFWTLVATQLTGIASTFVTRLSEGGRHQTICQRFFFASLSLIGFATIVALILGSKYWLITGTTVSIMAVVSTLEVKDSHSKWC